MKNMSPIRNSRISWIVIGGLLVIGGIVYHLAMVRCPYCGHSLAGYRPIPKECPCCHKKNLVIAGQLPG